MIRIGIDVDNCLRDFSKAMMDVFLRECPEKVKEPYRIGWDFINVKMPWEEKRKFWVEIFPEEILENSPPLENAVEDFKILKNWANENNCKLVCVTDQEKGVEQYTYKWLAKNNFIFKELHITGDKHTIGLDYIYDDSPIVYSQWVENGNNPDNFFLKKMDYNEYINTKYKVERLIDIIKIL